MGIRKHSRAHRAARDQIGYRTRRSCTLQSLDAARKRNLQRIKDDSFPGSS